MRRSAFLKGTVILSVATLLSKLLGSLFRIPLQNIAGDEVLGIFTLVYPVYMVALTLSVAGIPVAISKLIAEARSRGKSGDVHSIYWTSIWLSILLGSSMFLLIFLLSEPIAAALGGPSTLPALLIVSITLVIAPYMAVFRGVFQGFEDMKPTAISQVLEQFVRVALILMIAVYTVSAGFTPAQVSGGIMIGSSIGVLVSLGYLRYRFQQAPFTIGNGSKTYTIADFKHWSKEILTVSVPIAVGTITMALVHVVDALTIPNSLSDHDPNAAVNYLYGIYGRGLSLVQIATVVSTSVVLPLIPMLAKKMTDKQFDKVREDIDGTNHINHLLAWPAATGLFVLAWPLNVALFTNAVGTFTFAIIGLSSVFTALTIVSTGMLQGINKGKLAAVVVLIGIGVKIALNILLVTQYGLIGAAWSTLIIYAGMMSGNLITLNYHLPHRVFPVVLPKILSGCIVMGLVIGVPLRLLPIETWGRIDAGVYLLVAVLIGALVYGGSLVGMGAIKLDDLRRLLPFK